MNKITQGVARFQAGVYPKKRQLFRDLAEGQEPLALFITCADSRVNPNLITQTEPGDLFICRNAGNIIPPVGGPSGGMTASIEYAVAALNVPDIIVCGHSHCGAMKGAMYPESTVGLPHITSWLKFSQAALKIVEATSPDLTEDEKLRALIERNVLVQIQHLRTHPYVAARLAEGRLNLHAWVYDIETGGVVVYDDEHGAFVPIEEAAAVAQTV